MTSFYTTHISTHIIININWYSPSALSYALGY